MCAPREIKFPLVPFFPSARVLGPAVLSLVVRSLRSVPERVYEISETAGSSLLARDSIAILNRPLDKAHNGPAVGNLFILIS